MTLRRARQPYAQSYSVNPENRKGRPFRAAFVLPVLFFSSACNNYQVFLPWQELEQELDVAFQPMVVVIFLTPLLCVAALNVVVL